MRVCFFLNFILRIRTKRERETRRRETFEQHAVLNTVLSGRTLGAGTGSRPTRRPCPRSAQTPGMDVRVRRGWAPASRRGDGGVLRNSGNRRVPRRRRCRWARRPGGDARGGGELRHAARLGGLTRRTAWPRCHNNHANAGLADHGRHLSTARHVVTALSIDKASPPSVLLLTLRTGELGTSMIFILRERTLSVARVV